MQILAHVYPGWHPTPERDANFHPGFTEWELVAGARPRFPGQRQPRVPALGAYDDRDPREVERRARLALEHGVDGFCYGFFWCRGKRVFQEPLDEGFLGASTLTGVPFALMWANRMPRRVLPVRHTDRDVIDPARRVSSDVEDFVELVRYVAGRYFTRPGYVTRDGRSWFSIFDSTFFLRELGIEGARTAIAEARAWLDRHGFPGLFLAAVDPAADVVGSLRSIGFDAVTHYVHLPRWKGPTLQDYTEESDQRASEWPELAELADLPYIPSISPGWDATPRGADFGDRRPDRYPWSPVITGESPPAFERALSRALAYAEASAGELEPTVFVASLNEWSEGHAIEPDAEFGTGWLEAIARARRLRAKAST